MKRKKRFSVRRYKWRITPVRKLRKLVQATKWSRTDILHGMRKRISVNVTALVY